MKKIPKVINSTVEFLVFTMQEGKESLDVYVKNETLWMTQKIMAALFDCSIDNIALHLKNIYAERVVTDKIYENIFYAIKEQ